MMVRQCNSYDNDDAHRTMRGVSRRALLAALPVAAFTAATSGIARTFAASNTNASPFPRRVVSLEFGHTQLALSLGIVPLAVLSPSTYREFVIEPELPADVLDAGALPAEPNLEFLRYLQPDLILGNPTIEAAAGPQLKRIARFWGPFDYFYSDDPFRDAELYFRDLASVLGVDDIAETYCADLAAEFAVLQSVVQRRRGRPMLITGVMDRRHAWVATRNHIFHGALDRLGIPNAWPTSAGIFGTANVGLAELAEVLMETSADIIVIDRPSIDAYRWMSESPLWRVLPAVQEGRAVLVPPIWHQAGLPAIKNLMRYLPDALARIESANG